MNIVKILLSLLIMISVSACEENKTSSTNDNSNVLVEDYNKKKEAEKFLAKQTLKEKEEKDRLEAEKLLAEQIENERIANLDPYKNYEEFNLKVSDKVLEDLIKNSIKDYEIIVDSVRNDFDLSIQKIKEPRNENIAELSKSLNEEKNNLSKICEKMTTEKLGECKSISSGIYDIEFKIKIIQNNTETEIENLTSERDKKLNKFNKDMKRNINHLLSQLVN
jgi:hypothetical protein